MLPRMPNRARLVVHSSFRTPFAAICRLVVNVQAYKEVKSEKREQFVEKEPSMNVQNYYVETVTPKSTPDPLEYSKWYRTKSKGKLEIGMSLVRVTGWINRFLANVKKPQGDRKSGELNNQGT